MRRILLATSAALALTGSAALAGNLSEPVIEPAPAPIPVAPVAMGADWTGFYAGGSLGYADVTEDSDGFVDDGLTYGVHAGYDYDFGSVVLGGELELSGFDLTSGGVDVDSVARAKVRAGYDAGNALPYLAAGVAQLNTGGGLEADDTGLFYGAGLDYKVTDGLRVGGEILQHEFEDFSGTGLNVDATTIGARVSFEF